MLLANQRFQDGNQILARMMSLEINFREKKIFKYVHVQMALPKKIFKCVVFLMKYCLLKLPYLYLTATNNKEFTGKARLLRSVAKAVKKKIG